jgi:hypothetical protein
MVLVSAALVTVCGPRLSAGVDRLIWRASGTIQSITADSLTVNRFDYKLNSTTVYEKDHHQTTRSAFAPGDRVKITFITDRSVLKLEGETTNAQVPASTPTPAATPQPTKFTAKLAPLGASTARGDSFGSYSTNERTFAIRVRIPQNSIPLATTDAEARALSVKATITRRGETVATCSTAFEPRRRKRSVYEFKTHIQSNGRYSSSKIRFIQGRCVLANGISGLPTIRTGDVVTVSETTAGEFLRGGF